MNKKAGSTTIIKCRCIHLYQDTRYGAQYRVHNICDPKKKQGGKARCTVCRELNHM